METITNGNGGNAAPGEKRLHIEDLKNVVYFTNSLAAGLFNKARDLMKKGIDVKFVNVPEAMRTLVRKLGLNDVINCD